MRHKCNRKAATQILFVQCRWFVLFTSSREHTHAVTRVCSTSVSDQGSLRQRVLNFASPCSPLKEANNMAGSKSNWSPHSDCSGPVGPTCAAAELLSSPVVPSRAFVLVASSSSDRTVVLRLGAQHATHGVAAQCDRYATHHSALLGAEQVTAAVLAVADLAVGVEQQRQITKHSSKVSRGLPLYNGILVAC